MSETRNRARWAFATRSFIVQWQIIGIGGVEGGTIRGDHDVVSYGLTSTVKSHSSLNGRRRSSILASRSLSPIEPSRPHSNMSLKRLLPNITWGHKNRQPSQQLDLLDPFVLPQARPLAPHAESIIPPPAMAELPDLSWSSYASDDENSHHELSTPPASTEKKKKHFSLSSSKKKQVRFESPPPSPPVRGAFVPANRIRKKPPPPPPPPQSSVASHGSVSSDKTAWPTEEHIHSIQTPSISALDSFKGFEYTPRVYKSVWRDAPELAVAAATRLVAEQEAEQGRAHMQQPVSNGKLSKSNKKNANSIVAPPPNPAAVPAAHNPWTYTSPFGTPRSQIEEIAQHLTGGRPKESSIIPTAQAAAPMGEDGWKHTTWESTPVRGPYYGMDEIQSRALSYAVGDNRY